MIAGIGVDLTSIERIGRVWRRAGERFARHVLAEAEQRELAAVTDPARFLAKRWAAKEAFAKAAGTGMRAPLNWTSISVAHDPLGRPSLEFSDVVRAWLSRRGIEHCHLSLSDERDHVCAFVVLETTGAHSHVN